MIFVIRPRGLVPMPVIEAIMATSGLRGPLDEREESRRRPTGKRLE
jgi:hypothetical protein